MFVVSNGPPPVSGTMMSKSCSAPTTEKKTERRIIGPSSGSVMCQNRCQGLAPSISAASSSDRSMPWSPAT